MEEKTNVIFYCFCFTCHIMLGKPSNSREVVMKDLAGDHKDHKTTYTKERQLALL